MSNKSFNSVRSFRRNLVLPIISCLKHLLVAAIFLIFVFFFFFIFSNDFFTNFAFQAESELELVNLKSQRDADASDHRRSAEKDAAAFMAGQDEGSLEHFVRNILLPRHLKEMADLTERLQRSMQAAKQEAKAKVKRR